MARITLGLGTSHTPMLLVDAADLQRYEENDQRLPLVDHDGQTTTFTAMAQRVGGSHADAITPDALTIRHRAARCSIDALADALAEATLDALVIIGDDQQEMLRGGTMPPLLIYTEPVIRAERPAHAPDRPTWVLRGTDRYYPAAGPIDYPVHQRLALHLLDSLRQQGFGAAPAETNGAAMGHAFAFICTQLMRRTQVPIVPVLLNALYPPTQPDPEQCLRIGTAMAHAIAAFPADARVGIVASGGLSHFVVDETFDRLVVQALSHDDQSALAALPDHKLQSGSGEIRNWICAAGALRSLAIDRIDYLPGYRTRAGTGTGLCFAVWR